MDEHTVSDPVNIKKEPDLTTETEMELLERFITVKDEPCSPASTSSSGESAVDECSQSCDGKLGSVTEELPESRPEEESLAKFESVFIKQEPCDAIGTQSDASDEDDLEAVGRKLAGSPIADNSSTLSTPDRIQTVKKFKCDLCPRYYGSAGTLKRHGRTHSETPPFCEVCNRIFSTAHRLGEHMKTHLPKRHEEYKCDQCPKVYLALGSLRRHSLSHSDNPLTCAICKGNFSTPLRLSDHMKLHLKVTPDELKCDVCSKAFTRPSSLKRHSLVHIENPQKCNICDRVFASQYLVAEHSMTHVQDKPDEHECGQCQMTFSSKKYLALHRLTHGGVCHICCKVFETRPQLVEHLESHDAPDLKPKLFHCTLCTKSFPRRKSCFLHIRTHTKPYECQTCFKSFSTNSRLREHLPLHSGSRDWKCEQCDKTFVTQRLHSNHVKTHSKPFRCDVCFKSFARKPRMIEHLQRHENNREAMKQCLRCPECNMYFSIYVYKRHLRTHEKKYRCDLCGESFESKEDIRLHVQSHLFVNDYQ